MAEDIRIRGTVQGVGFRPTVARLARARGLSGWVRNDAEGVLLRLTAPAEAVDAFLTALRAELPPLARIEAIERSPGDDPVAEGFAIVASGAGRAQTAVAPDAVSCAACAAEVLDPRARRFRYPFTNCTHCGPRFSIQRGIPYDRPQTTMRRFAMCADCRREYADETDRRFHAQPIACPACGPTVRLVRADGHAPDVPIDACDAVGRLLLQGQIVALKGLGGYQLWCDATNEAAVRRLRERKRRPAKPLAVMARDLALARRYATIGPAEEEALRSPAGPIVLLARRDPPQGRPLAPSLAPDQRLVGIMLATTPLHQLALLGIDRPVVCTSGNVSEEPQAIDNDDAHARLGAIADWFLDHDRPIANRVDDSVVRLIDGAVRVLRAGRGYAPVSHALPGGFAAAPPVLAVGGALKNGICLLGGGRAVLSQYFGDLDELATVEDWQRGLFRLQELYQHAPEAIATDLHPGYRSSELARGLASARGLPLIEVQHHHAHIASCLAENGHPLEGGKVLGLALDGLGLGPGHALLGGELLSCDYRGYERLGSLKPVALLGGDRAAREPWRNLYAQLRDGMSWEELERRAAGLPLLASLRDRPLALLEPLLTRPGGLCTSAGRLFDAVAAAVGIHPERTSYEGQAAMALEALVSERALADAGAEPYRFELRRLPATGLPGLEPRGLWQAILRDLRAATPPATIAARFHRALADGLGRLVARGAESTGHKDVALAGGVFQNRVLTERLADDLRGRGFRVLMHHQVPPNDQGLALGQAVIAAARMLDGHAPIRRCDMCLGIPGQVVSISDPARQLGIVEIGGVRRETNLMCVVDEEHPIESCVGDWVLVHVGFAMNRLDPAQAARTLELLHELGEVEEQLRAMRNSGAQEER